ncbi:MAG: RICIN domain-containing protein, partial [Planctomycetales bacterium]|nr:RICIN domain-containing protein [Planctomycetales bacterium]
LDADGKGDTDMVVKAIQRAVDKGANIINISLGSEMDDYALSQMAAYANSKNIMIFASSGNNSGLETMTYPGKYSWVSNTYRKTLGIGSVDSNNKLSSFTSYGYHLYGVAPGNGIVAAHPGNQSVVVKGTSFAAPMFTGAAALALSEMPGSMDRNLLPDFFWSSMDWSVVDLNPGVGGARLLNVEKLLRSIPGFTEPEYILKSVNSPKCLEVDGWNTSNGGNVQQWGCTKSSNQRWKLIPEGDYYKLINVNSGKALDVAGGSSSDGANVHQWDYVGANNQKWKLVNSDNGSFELKAVHSNKCLDVAGISTADGANVHQWSCTGGNNQKWTLELAN